MTPIEKDKIITLCGKWGLKELNFTKGVYIAEDGTGITANLRGDNPVVGVTIAGELHTEGHGNLKVEDYQREVEAIMKSSSKKSQSLKNDKKQEVKDESQKIVQRKSDDQNILTTGHQEKETKGGWEAPPFFQSSSTEHLKKFQKAKCKECKVEFELTLDEAKMIFEQYDGIYCLKCREKEAKHEKKEAKNEKKEGDNKTMEAQITVCKACGLELSGVRALECFQKDLPFVCEDCEDKSKSKGDKIMDEKLPAIINENENKLTVNIIKQYICPTATDAEAYNFLQLCVHRDLNPFLKEAYLIKYGNMPATMVVGKDAFIRKAAESGQYDGFEAGIIIKTSAGIIERRVGVIQFEGDILVGGWVKVFRKDMKYPFVCEVPINEYMKYKDGKPQSSWAIMPGTMIRKVAVVQGHREAFAKELSGCYDAVEMGTQDNLK